MTSVMQTSPFAASPIGGGRAHNPDEDMEIDYFISSAAQVCVFHNKVWSKSLSWIEYNIDTSRLDFIMEDGDIRNFGIPVDPTLAPYFQNASLVAVIHLNRKTGEVYNGVDLPLILHKV